MKYTIMPALTKIKKLIVQSYSLKNENVIRQLEQEIVVYNDSSDILQAYAGAHANMLLTCQTAPIPISVEEAYTFRYLWVPIFYKLGKTALADRIGQTTFVYLFPSWNTRIQTKIDNLMGENRGKKFRK
ncbi:MAG: hypothetical protein NXI01_08005 [Gammaproteobacteria bacterium]|nr:hypothetical protein [Gammaproteobacteria bacterium]